MKILLLEDDIALNRAITKITQLDGHIATSYFDGEDVYNSITNRYDLYILDINVPNINGLKLLHLIYERDCTSKVIIVSANNDIYSIQEAYRLGCIDYLKKPFHLEELRIKIAKLGVDKDALLQELLKPDSKSLTKKEKAFLSLLLTNKGKVVSYTMIADIVYKEKAMSMDSLRALVKRLRAKLTGNLIQNVLDEGYKINT